MCLPEWRRALIQAHRLTEFARLRRVRDRIDREYWRPLDVVALARGAGMAAGHLSRQFRAAYGDSLYGYLTARRVERAAALLRHGDLSVGEVCLAVGCASPGTFTARFTELVGMPPGVFRRRSADAVEGASEPARGAGDGGPAVAWEGMPSWAAGQPAGPVRIREASAAVQPIA